MKQSEYKKKVLQNLQKINIKYLMRSGSVESYLNGIDNIINLRKKDKHWYKKVNEDYTL